MLKRACLVVLGALVACGGGKPTPKSPDPAELDGKDTAPNVVGDPATPKADPEDQPFPLWPEVKRGQLPDGLTYYMMKNKKPEKRVLLWLAVNSGAIQEDDDQRGLAHFVEHMAFNGTKRFPKNDIIKWFETIGMRFGADLNAYTSFDETVYQLEVPTDDKAHISKGLDVLRDWSGDITFDPKEVDLERGVVKEEWRLGRGAGARLRDKHYQVLYKGTRYPDRLPIGLPDILDKAPRDTLYRFYKDWYRPDHMAVIVVGDYTDGAAIEREIVAKFGDLAKPATPRARPRGGVPKAEGTRISIETDKEMTAQTIAIYNLLASRPEASRKDFHRSVYEQVYEQIFNERFRIIARRKEAAFTSAGASMSNNVREIDSFSRSATVKGGRVEDALRMVFEEVLRIEQHGFTQGELDRARVIIARRVEQSVVDAPTARSTSHASEITRNFLEGEFMIGRTIERDVTLATLPKITLAALNQLAKSYGGAENRAITISGPDDKPLPTRERVLALIDEVAKAKLEPWVDKPPPSALMLVAPKPGTITKEATLDKLGVTDWTLSNGIRVLVKPTDFEADSITVRGSSPGGLALANQAQYPHARFADNLAAIGGVADLDAEDVGKVLAGKQVSASTSIGGVTESVSGASTAKDLETMFQLLYLRATAPRKDDNAIDVWRTNFIESLQNREHSPDWQFSNKSDEVLWKNHPRRKAATPADIKKIDADKALAFYKDRFADMGDFTFVIVGNVDLAKLKPLVETYLASLPAKGRKEKEKDVGVRRVGGVVKKSWQLGQEPKARVSILFHGDEAWTRDKDRDMFVLSRILSVKLREEMRENKGGVYGVGAGGFLSRSPSQERSFSISFGADPARVDELVATAFEQIAKIAKAGVDQSYLDNLKKNFERDRELQFKSNSFWSGWLEGAARYNDDPNLVLDPAPMLARMTVDHLKASAKRYLDGKRYYQAVMLPAKAADAKKPPAAPTKAPPAAKQPPPAEKPPVLEKAPLVEKPAAKH